MESTIATELPVGQVPGVLAAIETATHNLIEQLLTRPITWWDGSSDLDGWARRTVLAHLHYGSQASRAVTLAALDGRSAPFYPGGDDQRDRTLAALDHRPLGLVTSEVIEQAERLAELWSSLTDEQWRISIDEPRLGAIELSRMAALRLTEVEVHTADLGVDRRWSSTFLHSNLPLRVAWLPQQHRRLDAEQGVRARWHLVGSRCGWLIEVEGAEVAITMFPPSAATPPGCRRIGGTDRDAMAIVLGRPSAGRRSINGQRPVPGSAASTDEDLHVALFRRVFPGP
jgi:uncharacterized protein (TIGR03083 family)